MLSQEILGATLVRPPNNLNSTLVKAIPQMLDPTMIYSGDTYPYQINPSMRKYMNQQISSAEREPKTPRDILRSIRKLVFRDQSLQDLVKDYNEQHGQIHKAHSEIRDELFRKIHLATFNKKEISEQIEEFLTAVSDDRVQLSKNSEFGNWNNKHSIFTRNDEIVIAKEDKTIFAAQVTPQGLRISIPALPRDASSLSAAIEAAYKESQAKHHSHSHDRSRKSQLGD